MTRLTSYAAVATGSAFGAMARYACSLPFHDGAGPLLEVGVPYPTFLVNVAGSFLIGVLAGLIGPDGRLRAGPVTQAFLMAGFCGGFTTFSIFSLEVILLIENGAVGVAASVVGVSVILWLVAVWCGLRFGQVLDRSMR